MADAGSSSPGPGILVGIARHGARRAPVEVVGQVEVTTQGGIAGDARGTIRPGGAGKRQVTLMGRRDWEAATAAIGVAVPWQERRVNLLVDGVDLPRTAGARLRIGAHVLLDITVACEPCRRMDDVAPGLHAALEPDWRGGVCARVMAGGPIAIGDVIRIEEA